MSISIPSAGRCRPATMWAILWLALAWSSPAHAAEGFIPVPADLQSCAGHYQAATNTLITVQCDGGALDLTVNSGSALEFTPEARDHYVNEPSGTKIHFLRNDLGQVTELVLVRDGEHHARRIADVALSSDPSASESVRSVNVDGTMFRTVVSGSGKIPVVLMGGIANWSKVAGGITDQAQVVRYEENGPRPASQAPLDVQQQIRLLHDLLTDLNISRPCILVGWSYNGALARLYADAYPDTVRGLVLVDPFDEGFVDWLKANQPQNYQLFRDHGTARYVLDWDDFIDRLHKARVAKSTPVVLLTAGHRQIRPGDALESQVNPADFQQAEIAVIKAHEAWIATVPAGRLVIVPDAGHDIPGEQPGYVVKAIQQELVGKLKP